MDDFCRDSYYFLLVIDYSALRPLKRAEKRMQWTLGKQLDLTDDLVLQSNSRQDHLIL